MKSELKMHGLLAGLALMILLSALNPALVGTAGSNWPKAAQQLSAHKWLAEAVIETVLNLFCSAGSPRTRSASR